MSPAGPCCTVRTVRQARTLNVVIAVQDVNVIRDAWDWAALAAGVVGSVAALIAIWFAVRAQRDATAARREVGVERRRQFEVEVLRGLLDDVDAGGLEAHVAADNPGWVNRYQHRLAMLSDEALPFWRTVMVLGWRDEVIEQFRYTQRFDETDTALRAAQRSADADEVQRLTVQRADNRAAFEDEVKSHLTRELLTAIRQRVDAPVHDPRSRLLRNAPAGRPE
jgi:hypothetical protein